ncbi:polysaccharide biosynthesis tyrosine autokinase [Leucothrix sargassi]|nr:polysaccharide biosynthesis tyrosine autokinase [Leucothrix sargassi]
MSRVPMVQQNGAMPQVGAHAHVSAMQPSHTTPVDDGQLSLREIFAILIRRKWTILFTILLTLMFALLFTFSTKPSYVAHATIQIEKEAPTVVSFSPTTSQAAPDTLQDPFFRTRYEMLKSRALAETVVEQENLETSLRTAGEPPESMKGFYSFFSLSKWLDTGDSATAQDSKPKDDITELFGKNLQVKPIDATHLVNIFYEGSSPNEAQRTVSAVISNFIQMQIDTKSETGEYAKTFLAEELEKAREKLQDAEKKLVEYSTRNGILNIDSDQTRHVRKLNELSSALVQAEIRRTAAESQFREMQNTGTVSTVLNNPVITNLKGQLVQLEGEYQEKLKLFKPGYPDMQRLNQQIVELRRTLNRELSTIKGSLESDFESARRQENKLRSELDSFNKQLYSLQGKGIDYNTLKREVDSSGALYNGLLQRVEEVGISSAANANTSNISIIDPPREPVKKYRPNPKLNVLVGTLAGILLGVGLAFLRDSLDQSIKSTDDLQKFTGLSVLGSIPKPDGKAKKNLALACKTAPDTQFAQAYRIFAANMKLQDHGADQVLLVTSAMGEEGKSTTASNLACAYAQMGMRVLLIDADLRLPSIHKKIGIQNTTGLSDYLGNETDLVGITQTIKAIPNLYVITAGNLKADPMQLLSSEKMAYLVAQASQRFDFVIMDSAPASGLAETLVLSSLATKTLMVTNERNMKTHSERIKRTVDSLNRIKPNVSGFLVVNAKTAAQQDHKYLQRSRQRNNNKLLGRS